MVPKLSIVYLLCSSLVVNLLQPSQAELFTAIAEVEHLLETHKRIIDDLDDYINSELHRLVSLKKHLNIYKREHEKAMEDIPNYLGNPINAFTLIKRLTTDLDVIEQNIKTGTEYTKNITINHDDVKYPGMEDLTGAAQALTRLQETYNLDIHDLSEGLLNGVVYSTPMSASDCYELGRALYNAKDYRHALPWMTEALRKYEDDETYTFSDTDILEYISFSHYLLGDVKSALEWTKKLLLVDPDHARARGNIPHYQKSIDEEEAIKKKQMRGETGEETEQEEPAIPKELAEFRRERKNYEMLCRGEMDISAEVAKRLYCRYLTENHPFLKLAPVKMEYMYLNPDVIVFYDVMSNDEIKYIQEKAKPRFKRAVVHDPKTGELIPAHYRISKSAWLRDDEGRVVARVSRRVADLTRLNMLSAEELQVVNYGIGGHYEPHYDFARMSDVAQGGATVFTQLGLSVFPIRGAALYWLNLHASGEGDLATRHAACPVLRGDKWVCNKWLHQGGQELIMPCNLEYQDENMVRSIPKPIPKTYR